MYNLLPNTKFSVKVKFWISFLVQLIFFPNLKIYESFWDVRVKIYLSFWLVFCEASTFFSYIDDDYNCFHTFGKWMLFWCFLLLAWIFSDEFDNHWTTITRKLQPTILPGFWPNQSEHFVDPQFTKYWAKSPCKILTEPSKLSPLFCPSPFIDFAWRYRSILRWESQQTKS